VALRFLLRFPAFSQKKRENKTDRALRFLGVFLKRFYQPWKKLFRYYEKPFRFLGCRCKSFKEEEEAQGL